MHSPGVYYDDALNKTPSYAHVSLYVVLKVHSIGFTYIYVGEFMPYPSTLYDPPQ